MSSDPVPERDPVPDRASSSERDPVPDRASSSDRASAEIGGGTENACAAVLDAVLDSGSNAVSNAASNAVSDAVTNSARGSTACPQAIQNFQADSSTALQLVHFFMAMRVASPWGATAVSRSVGP